MQCRFPPTATCIFTRPTWAALDDGKIVVLGDRTQAPSGTGYALENRLVLSRMLPELFRDCQVQRLAPFFQAVRDILQSIAPHNRDNPAHRPADAGAVTTRPTSSMPSWPDTWATRWSRGAICWSAAIAFI